MSVKYAIATGNWSSTAVWSDDGVTPGAAVPSSTDSVSMVTNITLTLDSNVTCDSIDHQRGTLSLASYKLTLLGVSASPFMSTNSLARTLNMGSGTLECSLSTSRVFLLSGTNLTLTAGTSQLILNVNTPSGSAEFYTSNKTFNNIKINISITDESVLNIFSTLNCNILEVYSLGTSTYASINSEDIKLNKLIAFGQNSTYLLYFYSMNMTDIMMFGASGGCYGNFIGNEMAGMLNSTGAGDTTYPLYIGPDSYNAGSGNVVLTLPPKISTIVEDFAGASVDTALWVTTGAGITVGSGVLTIPASGVRTFDSLSFYDIGSDSIYLKIDSSQATFEISIVDIKDRTVFIRKNSSNLWSSIGTDGGSGSATISTYPVIIRISQSSGTISVDYSTNNGASYSNLTSGSSSSMILPSVKIKLSTAAGGGPDATVIDYIKKLVAAVSGGSFFQLF